jgi:8-oxo-dGTP diphosphatase
MDAAQGIAVKSFIVKDGKVLLIRRSNLTKHKPGQWDIPGGRLEPGENPFDGLTRETMEETGLDIEIVAPLYIDYFRRDDGQQITMIIFLCKPRSDEIRLSKEHSEYRWTDLSDPEEFSGWFEPIFKNYTKYYSGR